MKTWIAAALASPLGLMALAYAPKAEAQAVVQCRSISSQLRQKGTGVSESELLEYQGRAERLGEVCTEVVDQIGRTLRDMRNERQGPVQPTVTRQTFHCEDWVPIAAEALTRRRNLSELQTFSQDMASHCADATGSVRDVLASLQRPPNPPYPLQANDPLTRELTVNDASDGVNRYYQYYVVLNGGERAEFTLRSEAFEPYLQIGAGDMADATFSYFNGTEGVNGVARLVFRADGEPGAPQRYTILAGAIGDGAGAYTIARESYVPTYPASQPIVAGTPATGSLTEDDAILVDSRGQFYDMYSFQGVAGQRVRISATAEFDTVLELGRMLDGEFQSISRNDDYNGYNPLVRNTLEQDDAYAVILHAYSPQRTGDYQVDLEVEQPPAPPPPPRDNWDASNAWTTSGALTDESPVDDQYRPFHEFRFRGARNRSYIVQYSSLEFDPYIEIFHIDRDGAQVWPPEPDAESLDEAPAGNVLQGSPSGNYVVRLVGGHEDARGAFEIVIVQQ